MASDTAITRPIMIIKARGSTEPQSGSRLLSPLAEQIANAVNAPARVHELVYPATFHSFSTEHPVRLDLGNSPHIGVEKLVGLMNNETTADPELRFVLLGWSQGAQVITDTLLEPAHRDSGSNSPRLNALAAANVAGIALFGNPTFTADEPHNAGSPTPGVNGVHPRPKGQLSNYSSLLRDYCVHDDIAAQATQDSTIDGHTSYFHNGLPDRAAEFILERLRDT